jgi:hypothetical protein
MINRKRFLKGLALGGAYLAGCGSVPSRGFVAAADPTNGKMLVGSLEQAINVRALVCRTSKATCPLPRLLDDGTYALPLAVLHDPEYSSALDNLSKWRLAGVDDQDFNGEVETGDSSDFRFALGDKLMRQAGRPASQTMPATGVFRFEVQPDDFGGDYDEDSGSRRSEIVARQQDGVGVGTVWASFCLILGTTPGLSDAGRGIVHQWHSVDEGARRTPVLFVDVANSRLTIRTCSSARLYGDNATGSQTPESGVQAVHYSAGLPAEGDRTFITLQATFGKDGHLNAWVDGTQVVETDTPIGYYKDLSDGSGRKILGYPHWGLYTTNGADTEVAYIANPEWGTTSLAGRIATPLPVPDMG